MSTEDYFSRHSTEACEDELCAWLQYPLEDFFDKKYCCDASVRSSTPLPNTDVARSVPDESPLAGHSTEEAGVKACAGSGSFRIPVQKTMAAKSFLRSSSVADNALASGAARVIGRSSRVGHDVFNKVKTTMQLQATPQITVPCYSSRPTDLKPSSSVKPNVLAPRVPKPPSGGLCNPTLHFSDTSSKEKSKHVPLEKFKKAYETHERQVSLTEGGRSNITEEVDSGEGSLLVNVRSKGSMTSSDSWGLKSKMGWAAGMLEDPSSYSGGSQTSLNLSFRDLANYGKRKYEESELQSEDADDRVIKTDAPRKSSMKRNRVPEVHNLSEKNRRNKINDKLKALQDLIPNSSKTDKASVLDEAIEYLKTLQLQLQMVLMRSTMNMPPMMMPMGFPQTPMHMGPLHSIGLGVPIGHPGMTMGLGLGMGMDAGLMQQSGWVAPFQTGPTVVTQHAVPFETGNIPSLHDSSQGYINVGGLSANFPDVIQKFTEASEQVLTRPPSVPHLHRYQPPKPGQQDFD